MSMICRFDSRPPTTVILWWYVFISTVLQSILILQIQWCLSFGGSLDSIGLMLVAKIWFRIHLNSTGIFSMHPFYKFKNWRTILSNANTLLSQVVYNILGIRCIYCCYLCCYGMCCSAWCLLLSTMYAWNFLCGDRSGKDIPY